MKQLIILAVVMMVGCNNAEYGDSVKTTTTPNSVGVSVIVIDNCEYLYRDAVNALLTHKGNCKFCEARRLSRN